ncbi:MAG TPA: 7TM domain-containing protein [Solirubrobacteraceae bacterium]
MSTERARWGTEHWSFLALMLIPAAAIALARIHGLPTASFLDRHLSLVATPPGLQRTVRDILFVPIGALVVVVVRLTLGIRLLGPFRSILLAFAFLTTGIVLGLVFLTLTVLILVLIRPGLRVLRLPYFGRVSVMISAVALVMIVGTMSSGWLSAPSLRNVAHFPIVVLVLVGEKLAVTLKREGARSGIWRAVTTAAVGVLVTGLASVPGLSGVLLAHPELMLVEIAAIDVVSTVCAWRALEFVNPRPARRGAARAPSDSRRHAVELAGAPRP